MKTSIYIKLFALLSILSLVVAKDTKAPKATKTAKILTEEDFKNPDKIITVEAEPVKPPQPVRHLETTAFRPRPPVLKGPEIASIGEFRKNDFLAAIAEEKFPTEPKAVGLVCRCPPYAATFICIGFASCDGCCIRVSEIYNPTK